MTSLWRQVSIVMLLIWLGGCELAPDPPQSLSTASEQAPWRIVATTGMVADIVRAVAGSHANVISLMGEGVDPHLYKPTVNDVKQLARADVIFYNGLALEGRLEATLRQLMRRGRRAFAVTDVLSDSQKLPGGESSGHPDPHVWMDIALWRQCTRHVANVLGELDPPNRDLYVARSATYEARLMELDAYIRQVIHSIPEEHRVLVTAHDAFHYFSRAYGIPVLAPQGISTESEPGVHDINELVDFLVQRRLPAIFVESSVSSGNLRAVLEGVESRGGRIAIGGTLFSDAMGPSGTYEGSYLGMMDHNATSIAQALGGRVPTGGWRGLLQPANSDAPLAKRLQ